MGSGPADTLGPRKGAKSAKVYQVRDEHTGWTQLRQVQGAGRSEAQTARKGHRGGDAIHSQG